MTTQVLQTEFEAFQKWRAAQAAVNPDAMINANAVRELCGGVSDMCIWRWLKDPELDFPKPVYINRRRYWKKAEIIVWFQSRGEQ